MRHIAFGLLKEYLYFLKNKSSREWIIIVWLFYILHLCVCVCVILLLLLFFFCWKSAEIKMTFDLIAWYLLFLRQFGIIPYVLILFYLYLFIYILFVAFKTGENNLIICTHRVVYYCNGTKRLKKKISKKST